MARVIRRETFRSAQPFSLGDVQVHADALLDRAREKAEAILNDARGESDKLFERRKAEGYRAGFDQGRNEGLQSLDEQTRREAAQNAEKKMKALNETLQHGLAEFEGRKRHMLAAAESGVIELACAIARRVCKAVPQWSLDAARANVLTVLEMVKHEHDLRLHVNPADLEGLREFSADLCGRIDRFDHVELIADDDVSRGGCILHGRNGSIDASIDTQLQHVADSLLHASQRRDPS